MEAIKFFIPQWAVCPIVNGDYSALNEEEEEQLNEFLASLTDQYGTAWLSFDGEDFEPEFRHSNDINNLGDNCYKMILIV